MSLCPNCQATIDSDFGMAQCHQCGAVVFIDLQGRAQIEGTLQEKAEEPVEEPVEVSAQKFVADGAGETFHDFADPELAPSPVGEDASHDLPMGDDEGGNLLANPLAADHPVMGDERIETTAPQAEMDWLGNGLMPDPALDAATVIGGSPSPEPAIPTLEKENFADVVRFANDAISQGAQGGLLFRLCISEIDTAETRRLLRESLDDVRFMWDANELMRGIDKGVLVIDRINAVKAAVLVARLRDLAVQVKWEQYAIHQS